MIRVDALGAAFDGAIATASTRPGFFTRRIAILVADAVGLSPLRCVEELERIGKCRPGAAGWFRLNGGFTIAHAREALAEAGREWPPNWIFRAQRRSWRTPRIPRWQVSAPRADRKVRVVGFPAYIDNSPVEWGDP